MGTPKKIIITASVITITMLLLGSIGIYLATRSTDIEGEMRQVEASEADTESFNRKLESLEADIIAAVDSGERHEVILNLTEAEVSATLGKMMQEAIAEASDDLSENMVMDAMVNLDEDVIRAVVGVEMAGVRVDAGVILRATADDQGLNFILEDIEIGKLPFTGMIEDKIRDRFNASHTNMDFRDLHIDLDDDLPVRIKDIVINDNMMAIIGETI